MFMHAVEIRLICKKGQYYSKWNKWTSDIKDKVLQQHWLDNLFAILSEGLVWVFFSKSYSLWQSYLHQVHQQGIESVAETIPVSAI